MARLPQPGGDKDTWGTVLNEFLGEAHNADGSLKDVPQGKVTNLTTDLGAKVPATRTVAGHPLSSDVVLSATDMGAEPAGLSTATRDGLDAEFIPRDEVDATFVHLAQDGQTPSELPVSAGTANVGSAGTAARADHVHPADGLYMWYGHAGRDVIFDGTATIPGYTRNGMVYTFGANPGVAAGPGVASGAGPQQFHDLTVLAGVTIIINGRIQVSGTLTNHGTVSTRGGDAVGATGGVAGPVGVPASFGGGAGANGGVGAGVQGSASVGVFQGSQSLYGSGAGGAGNAGAVAGGIGHNEPWRDFIGTTADPFTRFTGYGLMGTERGGIPAGHGGGSGGGDGTNAGGGGGGGAGAMIINARILKGEGVFNASGGNGAAGTGGNAGGGGAGAPAPIWINTTDKSGWTGTCIAAPGTPGAGSGTGAAGVAVTASVTDNAPTYLIMLTEW